MWRKPQVWLGFIISAIALFLAFRGIEWQQLGAALAQANYVYLLPAAGSLIVAISILGLHWSIHWLSSHLIRINA